ncbi:MAG TPA: Uma2 family endonuclease [Bryobacteraceae bacterium]|nr:Uma2 family endonuclease [Bryobacteraceae bacterium]
MPQAVSLDEYRNTDYEPDCEYVDGFLEERYVSKKRHSRTQIRLAQWLASREAEHQHVVLIAQRVQVSPSRVRVPDICLVVPDDHDEIAQTPPVVWIEILSPEDSWSRIQTKLQDCQNFGVRNIWMIDPYSNQAWVATPATGPTPVDDGRLRCAELRLEVALEEILPKAPKV